jgi:hypothetical protein
MLSPQALLRGLVARALPPTNADSQNNDVPIRMDSYGGLYTQPLVRKTHNLADEGSYFVCNNAQTAIGPTFGTAFAAASPFILIYNGQSSARLYLDYIALVTVVAGTCTTTAGYTAAAVVLDQGNRYSSAGSNLSANIVNPNMASVAGAPSGVLVYCGAIVATAANTARTVVGIRNIRPNVSSTVIGIVGDMNLITFGSVEGSTGSITVANANIMPQSFPPVVVGPGQSALLYLWYPVMTAPTAATYAPEIGFWVR